MTPAEFGALMDRLEALSGALGRRLARRVPQSREAVQV
jgi:hypothetical protein